MVTRVPVCLSLHLLVCLQLVSRLLDADDPNRAHSKRRGVDYVDHPLTTPHPPPSHPLRKTQDQSLSYHANILRFVAMELNPAPQTRLSRRTNAEFELRRRTVDRSCFPARTPFCSP